MRDKILKFIKAYREKNGYAPEQSEIANELGVKKQAIHYHFKRMKEDLKKYPEYRKLKVFQ